MKTAGKVSFEENHQEDKSSWAIAESYIKNSLSLF